MRVLFSLALSSALLAPAAPVAAQPGNITPQPGAAQPQDTAPLQDAYRRAARRQRRREADGRRKIGIIIGGWSLVGAALTVGTTLHVVAGLRDEHADRLRFGKSQNHCTADTAPAGFCTELANLAGSVRRLESGGTAMFGVAMALVAATGFYALGEMAGPKVNAPPLLIMPTADRQSGGAMLLVHF